MLHHRNPDVELVPPNIPLKKTQTKYIAYPTPTKTSCCCLPSSIIITAGAAMDLPAPLSVLLAQELRWNVFVGSWISKKRLMWL